MAGPGPRRPGGTSLRRGFWGSFRGTILLSSHDSRGEIQNNGADGVCPDRFGSQSPTSKVGRRRRKPRCMKSTRRRSITSRYANRVCRMTLRMFAPKLSCEYCKPSEGRACAHPMLCHLLSWEQPAMSCMNFFRGENKPAKRRSPRRQTYRLPLTKSNFWIQKFNAPLSAP